MWICSVNLFKNLDMIWPSKKFSGLVLCLEIAFIIIYAFLVTYNVEAEIIKVNSTSTDVEKRNSIQDYYPMFQDVNVMIFVGFGFLMTFMKKYGFSAVGLNFLLAAISVQWAMIMQGVWSMKNGKIPISIVNLINGNFASATVLISFGAVLGKTSPLQLVAMSILEITIFACNEHLGVRIYKAADIGGSMFLHTFGAYFGLGVAYMLYRKDIIGNNKEGSNYHSDIFAMIGTIFLWMFWPSFNSALAVGNEQHRSVINTFVALLACCVITFAISSLVDGEGRLNMVHIQNATLAGGVAIGSTANMLVHPFGAMIIGALAAIISTIGYKVATPYLAKNLNIHDTCGVNNLHGMPGILAGLVSIVVASMAREDNYGLSLYQLYPARTPAENTTEFQKIHSVLSQVAPGYGWSERNQVCAQVEALFTTLAIAMAGGMVTGEMSWNGG
ncbi:ammonium transporter Rh type B [Caerostris darwini]|uniref:Ammonium transporter Rh type B n=1 Tax=Caerostris darwini TaxID=1538125 RepID=A0AAV4NSI4_9ARAC|nr:ammonium transporter Rh type B [Caerostris darwini]